MQLSHLLQSGIGQPKHLSPSCLHLGMDVVFLLTLLDWVLGGWVVVGVVFLQGICVAALGWAVVALKFVLAAGFHM